MEVNFSGSPELRIDRICHPVGFIGFGYRLGQAGIRVLSVLDCCFEAAKTKEVQVGGQYLFWFQCLLEYQLICKTVVVVVIVVIVVVVVFARFSLVCVQFNPFPIWTVSRPDSFEKTGGGRTCKRVNHPRTFKKGCNSGRRRVVRNTAVQNTQYKLFSTTKVFPQQQKFHYPCVEKKKTYI